ncbi:unnamed protein product [Leptidea sinapis]|uniref:Uncharacterized protein n=1 Tax=Leptidea sinapis TaxID=189913 RepID=A0A5E4PTM8_9NEOP|nr:unnamed protein product [Leptidea sinapis]
MLFILYENLTASSIISTPLTFPTFFFNIEQDAVCGQQVPILDLADVSHHDVADGDLLHLAASYHGELVLAFYPRLEPSVTCARTNIKHSNWQQEGSNKREEKKKKRHRGH